MSIRDLSAPAPGAGASWHIGPIGNGLPPRHLFRGNGRLKALDDEHATARVAECVQDTPPAEKRLALQEGNQLAVHDHVGIPLKCREVLVRVEVPVRSHSLARLEVDDTEQAVVNAAEGAISRISRWGRNHPFPPTRSDATLVHSDPPFSTRRTVGPHGIPRPAIGQDRSPLQTRRMVIGSFCPAGRGRGCACGV